MFGQIYVPGPGLFLLFCMIERLVCDLRSLDFLVIYSVVIALLPIRE